MDTFKIEVKSNLPSGTVFLGVEESRDVQRYLSGVEHEEVTDIEAFNNEYETRSGPGDEQPEPPGNQGSWLKKAEGAGTHGIGFEVEEGECAIVAMNEGASRRVDLDMVFGIKASRVMLLIGIIILVVGLGVLTGGILMAVFGAMSPRPQVPPPPPSAQVSPLRRRPSPSREAGTGSARPAANRSVSAPIPLRLAGLLHAHPQGAGVRAGPADVRHGGCVSAHPGQALPAQPVFFRSLASLGAMTARQ